MQVVDVDFVVEGVPAEFVGGPVDASAAHAAAGHPHGEAERVVLPAVVALGGRGAAELAAPENQRVFEQSATLRSVRSAAIGWSTAWQRLGRFSRRPL